MADVQIAIIDQQNTQIALAAPPDTQVTAAVPGVQGPKGEGVPAGGTTNQVLFKQSSTNYDTAWSAITSAMIGDLQIVDGDVSTTAAIAGTKISPNFGAQNVVTTGTSTAASFIPTSSSVPANGLYLPAANSVALSTGGTGRLFVDASGNVGINVSSDLGASKFFVAGNGTAGLTNIFTLRTAAANSYGLQIKGNNTNDEWLIQNYYSSALAFGTSNQERLRITSTGQLSHIGAGSTGSPAVSFNGSAPSNSLVITSAGLVGIGTSSPAYNIHGTGYLGLGTQASSGAGAGIHMIPSSSLTNWFVGSNYVTSGAFQIIPSTAGGGSTFTTPALTIDSSSRVGIGTTSPGYLLDIANATSFTGLRLIRTNNNNSLMFTVNSSDTIINAAGSGTASLTLQTEGTERARIDSSGRLGIGTSSPVGKINSVISQADTASASDTTLANSFLHLGGGEYGSGRYFLTTYGYSTGRTNSGAYVGALGTESIGYGKYALVFGTRDVTTDAAPTERLRITSAGLVGIGTSSPNTRLSVVGTASGLVNGAVRINTTAAAQSANSGLWLCGNQSTSHYNWLVASQFNVPGALEITPSAAVDGSTFTTPTAVFTQTGRVGIGTTSPGGALEVNAAALTAPAIFKINTAEAARIDSSGRLLVGTSSSSAEAKFIVQGGATAAGGAVNIQRNATTASAGSTIGFINFANSANNVGASISADGDGTWSAGTSHPTRLVFSTTADGASSPTERMRISNQGQITNFSGSATDCMSLGSAASAGTTYMLLQGVYGRTSLGNGGAESFRVYTNGNVQNTNNSYGAISDIKLKENIVDATPQWDDIRALQIRKYNFKEGQTHTQIGLVAQEVELVSPGLVSESPDRDAEGNDLGTVTKSVNYSVLYMKAVKALQEAMERIETLEAKVAGLEGA